FHFQQRLNYMFVTPNYLYQVHISLSANLIVLGCSGRGAFVLGRFCGIVWLLRFLFVCLPLSSVSCCIGYCLSCLTLVRRFVIGNAPLYLAMAFFHTSFMLYPIELCSYF
ncbi:MAG: hypothetical protein ACKPKO_39320, partial [Candidatus Fonsibacter sp.]